MAESQEDILSLFQEAALEILGKSFPGMTYQSTIADLGIDSFSTAQIIGKIEDKLGIRVDDDALIEIRTVQDLADAVAVACEKAGH